MKENDHAELFDDFNKITEKWESRISPIAFAYAMVQSTSMLMFAVGIPAETITSLLSDAVLSGRRNAIYYGKDAEDGG